MNSALQEAFIGTQAGWYLAADCASDGVVWSDLVEDKYWNFVVPDVEWAVADLEGGLARLQHFGRPPVVYITPSAEHLTSWLDSAGFKVSDHEAVMSFQGAPPSCPIELDFRLADPSSLDDLIDVFVKAHSGEEDDLYGELAPTYVECLARSIGRSDTWHYIGYLNSQPVAIGSMAKWNQYVGLYNAAVDPSFRRRGFGTAVLRHRIAEGHEKGGTTFFLQTVAGEHVERRYQRYGFATSYVGHIYVQDT